MEPRLNILYNLQLVCML